VATLCSRVVKRPLGLGVVFRIVVRGIILAAGASSRMGRPKAALPVDAQGTTFVLHLTRTLLDAGLTEVVVVTGAHPDEVTRALSPRDSRVRVVHNADWQRGQLSSLQAALRLTEPASNSPVIVDAVLMTLVDIPLVSVATVASVLDAWRTSGAPIVRPARGSEHGHPVVFDRSLFAELLAADPDVGAKAVIRAHAAEILNLPIDDPGAYADIDTRADYTALRQQHS
jgi:molybdenum cofactor cytidylyltransferase